MVASPNWRMLQVLREDSQVLERIQSEFHSMIRQRLEKGFQKIEMTCFFEELQTPGLSNVVGCSPLCPLLRDGKADEHGIWLGGYGAFGFHPGIQCCWDPCYS